MSGSAAHTDASVNSRIENFRNLEPADRMNAAASAAGSSSSAASIDASSSSSLISTASPSARTVSSVLHTSAIVSTVNIIVAFCDSPFWRVSVHGEQLFLGCARFVSDSTRPSLKRAK